MLDASSLQPGTAVSLAPDAAPFVQMGEPAVPVSCVLFGRSSRRSMASLTLTPGERARPGSVTAIYLGSSIMAHLQTSHHAVIREQNVWGDDMSIGGNTVFDYSRQVGSQVKMHTNVSLAQFSMVEDEVFITSIIPGVSFASDLHPVYPMSASKYAWTDDVAGCTARCERGGPLPYVVIGEHALISAGASFMQDYPAHAVAGAWQSGAHGGNN